MGTITLRVTEFIWLTPTELYYLFVDILYGCFQYSVQLRENFGQMRRSVITRGNVWILRIVHIVWFKTSK